MTDVLANDECELLILSESPYDTPQPHKALQDPEGLSAMGGDLSTQRLIHLYQHGFFPWYSEPDPILWWHPEQRCTLSPDHFHLAKSLKKTLKKSNLQFSINQAFHTVIHHCADLRAKNEGTWISDDIKQAYSRLHELGFAHSVEVWQGEQLVGGFYGVAMGQVFFGESMFSLQPNASKMALKAFCDKAKDFHIALIDCQVESDHLLSLGANLSPRNHFISQLKDLIPQPEINQKLIEFSKNGQKQPINV
ncbi:leucyl/phenylalanyl-tRNA--protein transferase [Marinomonas posidonica]|uniref:Leucyl/phenylalanyl-tRNA--protein transferase n=1 Tax=Marinomonas posidonica (strain CECT 7376 / NCIMB 14433 / IVIA-Po-181) TaxID=491952 RepID=F6CTH6_MARPP|nr:leucyl/phenylalanyl-tRNA--protein transferase [Marinomonas posidonica]AEF54025.1 Leucyl/phenylalanyl-tRNA--protein transferase [Marinomonas posidonica IVIA-Po-181]